MQCQSPIDMRTHSLILIFTACLPILYGCTPSTSPNDSQNMPDDKVADIKPLLQKMIDESFHCYTIDCFEETPQLRKVLAEEAPDWAHLSPLEAFFVFEAQPDLISKADPAIAANAYCAGIKELTSNWWGSPGTPDGDAAAHLLAIPGIEDCLRELLEDQSPLSYHGSEIATMNEMFAWTVADLAGGFIAAIREEAYPFRDDPEERTNYRKGL